MSIYKNSLISSLIFETRKVHNGFPHILRVLFDCHSQWFQDNCSRNRRDRRASFVAIVTRVILVVRGNGTVCHTSEVVNGTQVDVEVSPLDGPLWLQLKIVLSFKTGRLLKWIAYPARRWSREWDKAYENAIQNIRSIRKTIFFKKSNSLQKWNVHLPNMATTVIIAICCILEFA